MKTLLALFAMLLLVTSCKTPFQRDVSAWTHISCSGPSSDWSDCWSKAKAICPSGYDWTNKIETRKSLRREVDVICESGV